MLGEDRVLREQVGRPAEQVRRVRILGDQAQGLLLAAAADQDRDTGS
jgi:hypothetical protein